jgi:hypothetical protein
MIVQCRVSPFAVERPLELQRNIRDQYTLVPIWQAVDDFSVRAHQRCEARKVLING